MTAKNRTFSSELLAPVAQVASKAILEFAIARKPPSCEGANIATQLRLIAEALKPRLLYQLPLEVQELCFLVLRDLFDVCTVCFSIPVPKIPRRFNILYPFPISLRINIGVDNIIQLYLLSFLPPFSMIPLAQSFPLCAAKARNSLYITFYISLLLDNLFII
jgi:hypothetical protein